MIGDAKGFANTCIIFVIFTKTKRSVQFNLQSCGVFIIPWYRPVILAHTDMLFFHSLVFGLNSSKILSHLLTSSGSGWEFTRGVRFGVKLSKSNNLCSHHRPGLKVTSVWDMRHLKVNVLSVCDRVARWLWTFSENLLKFSGLWLTVFLQVMNWLTEFGFLNFKTVFGEICFNDYDYFYANPKVHYPKSLDNRVSFFLPFIPHCKLAFFFKHKQMSVVWPFCFSSCFLNRKF